MQRTKGRDDSGVSLIEVLIAVAIMGLAMTAIVGALGAQLSGARAHRDQSNAGTVVSAALESVKAINYDTSCDTAGTFVAYAVAARDIPLPSDWVDKGWTHAQAITLVPPLRYWDGVSFQTACRDNEAADSAGLLRQQEVVVRVQGPDGPEETFSVVKTGPVP